MKKQPQRMCVTCRERRDKKDLLRVVLTPEGEIKYDPTGRTAGRGSYLCKNEKCILTELKAHRLSKGLRHNVDDDALENMAKEILALCEDEKTV